MALLTVDLFSESLEVGTSMTRGAPPGDRGADRRRADRACPEHGWPVLYLLHGLSDDHTAWLRYTSIERLRHAPPGSPS